MGFGGTGRRGPRSGLHTSRIDGSPLLYNRQDPRLPDLVVCRPELADAVLEVTRD